MAEDPNLSGEGRSTLNVTDLRTYAYHDQIQKLLDRYNHLKQTADPKHETEMKNLKCTLELLEVPLIEDFVSVMPEIGDEGIPVQTEPGCTNIPILPDKNLTPKKQDHPHHSLKSVTKNTKTTDDIDSERMLVDISNRVKLNQQTMRENFDALRKGSNPNDTHQQLALNKLEPFIDIPVMENFSASVPHLSEAEYNSDGFDYLSAILGPGYSLFSNDLLSDTGEPSDCESEYDSKDEFETDDENDEKVDPDPRKKPRKNGVKIKDQDSPTENWWKYLYKLRDGIMVFYTSTVRAIKTFWQNICEVWSKAGKVISKKWNQFVSWLRSLFGRPERPMGA